MIRLILLTGLLISFLRINAQSDDCLGATSITSSTICTSSIIGSSEEASQSMVGCSGNADDDVWYKFIATSVSHSLSVIGSPNFSPTFEVFSGTCASLTSIDCNSDASTGGTGSSHLSNLNIGSVYYIRIYHYYSGSGSGTFTVCLIDAPAPLNDDCSGAISVSPSSSVCSSPTVGSSQFANQSLAGCVGNADDDVWYKFVATSNTHSITVSPSTSYDAVLELFSGSCGSLVSMNCVDNASSNAIEKLHVSNLTIGNTYYLRIYDYHPGSSTNTFTLCITIPTVLPPTNDNCSGAVSLPVTPNCLVTSTVVSSIGATQSLPGCVGTADDDIWFSFVAPTSKVAINVLGDATTDAVIQLFTGNCFEYTSLNCRDVAFNGIKETLLQSGLTIGETYYFRIYNYNATGGSTFTVNVERVELTASSTSTNICLGQNVTLTATGTPTYSWSNGVSNGVPFTPTITTTYTVSGVGTGSCVNTATVLVNVSSVDAPEICMVTIDTANVNNEIYWDKYSYTNIDSMIIYREVVANTFQRIGAVNRFAYSRFKDTARSIGFRNGDPNIRSYKYKLQIRDTCGNYSPLSLYNTSLFLNNNGPTFNWNFYDIENTIGRVNNYELYRDNLNNGIFILIATVPSTIGVTTYTYTDPNYSTYISTARWAIAGDGFLCSPAFRLINPTAAVVKTKGNVKNQFSIPDPPVDPNVQSVKEINSILQMVIMPNPASTGFDVVSDELLSRINIYNSLGAVVYTIQVNEQKQIHIDTQELSNGIYNIEVINRKSKGFKKLVINK